MDEKLEAWSEMNFSEKQKYNGYSGFVNGELFSESNQFMTEDRSRLDKRLVKEKNRLKMEKEK